MRTFQRSCRVSRASKRSSRLSLTLIEFPSGRYYLLHPKVGLRWLNYLNTFTSFRICHMVQRSLTKFFYVVVYNYVGHWLDLIRNLSYGPMAIILGLGSGEKEVYWWSSPHRFLSHSHLPKPRRGVVLRWNLLFEVTLQEIDCLCPEDLQGLLR